MANSVIDADKGYTDNDGSPLLPRRPAHLDLIDRLAVEALSEIRAMVDAALLQAGYSAEWIHRSRGQRARFARERKLKQGAAQ